MQREAVLVPFGDNLYIQRVITYTPDGRALVRIWNERNKLEPIPGEWDRCGHFELRRYFPWIFLRWVFIPQQKPQPSLTSHLPKHAGCSTLES